ncbi:MAG: hypothetical protein GX039_03555 [Clostridia bacterium]|nr:hypothetical protein [Clostridia bacterium]
MLQIHFSYYARPRRGRCECCNRQQTLEQKLWLQEDDSLIGDLSLCSECAAVWEELLGQGKEKIIQEWNFCEGVSGS